MGGVNWENGLGSLRKSCRRATGQGLFGGKGFDGDGLKVSAQALACQGWAMLFGFLAGLAAICLRIDDQSFNLARAMRWFETTLRAAQDPDTAIALGTHGQSVIRLAGIAGEFMSNADTAVLRECAAASVFLQRFPQWRAPLDDHHVQPIMCNPSTCNTCNRCRLLWQHLTRN